MTTTKVEIREAQRDAFCRVCDGLIPKGTQMVSWYSRANRGMNIHIHADCAENIGNLVKAHKAEAKNWL